MQRALFLFFLWLVAFHALPLRAAPAGPPTLLISPTGPGEVTLNWLSTNDWLQGTSQLADPFYWSNINITAVTSITVQENQQTQFFRLVQSVGAPPPTELFLETDSDTNGGCYFALNWDAVPGAVSYNLYMAAAPGVNPQNYSSLPGGAVFSGINNIFAAIPDIPDGVFTPALIAGTNYYFVVTAVSAGGVESAPSLPASGVFGPSATVQGGVFALLTIGSNTQIVFLPQITMSLVNSAFPAFSNSVSSDVTGNFLFSAMPAGNYQLSWSGGGFAPGYTNVVISNTAVNVYALQLTPISGQGLVYGKVTYQDGSSAYDVNPGYGIDIDPTVTLTDANNTFLGKALVNSSGDYVIGGFTPAASVTASAAAQSASVSKTVNALSPVEADLVLPETPPVIESIVALSNGVPVDAVSPGATVEVVVTATGNNLAYSWFDLNGPAALPLASNVWWTVPATAAGVVDLWAEVSDGSGGYAVARLQLSLNPSVVITGTVLDEDSGLPVVNATVELNGQPTTTDANGDFFFGINPAGGYHLNITAGGYASLDETFSDAGDAGNIFTLLPISTPLLFTPPEGPVLAVTNCANGITAMIPTDGLTESNGDQYDGPVNVSLDALDPCSVTNSLIGVDLTSNGDLLTPYGLVNLNVTDEDGNPLSLAPGYSAEVYLPITASCMDANFTQPAYAYSFQIDPATGFWTPIDYATLTTNVVCGTTTPWGGYQGYAVRFGFFSCGRFRCCPVPPPQFVPVPPPPQVIQPPQSVTYNLRLYADDTLHVPLGFGLMYDNGQGVPDTNNIYYRILSKSGQLFTNGVNTVGATVWLEILNLRQSPGVYYGTGGPTLYTYQKNIMQLMKFTVPATSGQTVIMTLGLGMPLDQPRIAPLTGLAANTNLVGNGVQAGTLGQSFLVRGNPNPKTYNATQNYYPRVDKPGKKTNFHDWQVANGWDPNEIGPYGGIGIGDNAHAVYFNANDLGAGRRMGMKIFTDLDGSNSVAYYIATYDSLTDAQYDESLKIQPGDMRSKLKYMVCMDYSLPRTASNTRAKGGRFIKFFAYTNAVNMQLGISPVVATESRALTLPVPYLCLKCHGGGSPDLTGDNKDQYGDIGGRFTPFDVANYTFASATPSSSLSAEKQQPIFTALNKGLLISQNLASTPMPVNLNVLLNYMINNNVNYTTRPPPKQGTWGDWTGNANLYNKAYAASCRTCHVTQNGGNNWSTPADLEGDLVMLGDPVTADMPHSQRTYGAYWGSATGQQLNNLNAITQPVVISQPAIVNSVTNTSYFQAP